MKKHKVLLLDVDGVLVLPPKLFSEVYCEKYGVDQVKQQKFYATHEFEQSLLGKLDLVEAIKIHNDLWQWKGDFNELVRLWLEAENYPNTDLVQLVTSYRQQGLPIYLATQQEKHRAKYLGEQMFNNILDGAFCSCDVQANKHDVVFWQAVIESLSKKYGGIQSNEIVYFDDRPLIVNVAKESGIDAYLYTKVGNVKANVRL